SRAYLYALMTLWAAGLMWFALEKVVGEEGGALLPTLVWSYAVATTPWSVIALQEGPDGRDGIGRFATVAFHLGYGLMAAMAWLGAPLGIAVAAFGAVM